VSDFLHDVDGERGTVAPGTRLYSKAESILEDNPFTLFVERWREGLEFAARWPLILHDVGSDFIIHVLQPLYFGRRPRLGDGKPIIIVAEDVVSRATLAAFATWLTGIGYRPVNANVTSADGMPYHEALGQAIRNAAVRTGRKVTIVALEAGFQRAIYAAAAEPAHVSAIVALTAPNHRLAVQRKWRRI